MRYTRENVQQYYCRGANPVQIDGIPEGFSFKYPDLIIGGIVRWGKYKVFVPLTDIVLSADTEEVLLDLYNKQKNGTK